MLRGASQSSGVRLLVGYSVVIPFKPLQPSRSLILMGQAKPHILSKAELVSFGPILGTIYRSDRSACAPFLYYTLEALVLIPRLSVSHFEGGRVPSQKL